MRLILLLLSTISVAQSTSMITRSSCLEHYLAGNSDTGTYLIKDNGKVIAVECTMNDDSVETIVHNALEPLQAWSGSYILEPHGKSASVGYQMSLDALENLGTNSSVEHSQCRQVVKCEHKSKQQFSNLGFLKGINNKYYDISKLCNEKESDRELEVTSSDLQEIGLVPPVIAIVGERARTRRDIERKVTPSGVSRKPQTAKLNFGSLHCTAKVDKDYNCAYTLTKSDALEIVLDLATNVVTFSFRTESWNSGLVEFNSNTRLRYEDGGYAIFANVLNSRGTLLSDGEWHKVEIKLSRNSCDITVDDLRLPAIVSEREMKIKISPKMQNNDSGKNAAEELHVTHIRINDKIICHEHRRLIPRPGEGKSKGDLYGVGEQTRKFVNCGLPATVWDGKAGCTNTIHKEETACLFPFPNSEVQTFIGELSTHKPNFPNSLAFNFQSDQKSAFLFALHHSPNPTMHKRLFLQMVYLNNTDFIAYLCNGMLAIPEQCLTCEITRDKGFNTLEWITVAFIRRGASPSYEGSLLVVDGQSCTFSKVLPKDGYDLVDKAGDRIAYYDVLFIGGVPHPMTDFSGDMRLQASQDLPGDGKLSRFRGCIANLHINKKQLDLNKMASNTVGAFKSIYRQRAQQYIVAPGESCDCQNPAACFPVDGQKVSYDCDCSRIGMPRQSSKLCEEPGHDNCVRLSSNVSSATWTRSIDRGQIDQIWIAFKPPMDSSEFCFAKILQDNNVTVMKVCSKSLYEETEISVTFQNNNMQTQKLNFRLKSITDHRSFIVAVEQRISDTPIIVKVNNLSKTADKVFNLNILLASSVTLETKYNQHISGCVAEFYVTMKYSKDSIDILKKMQFDNYKAVKEDVCCAYVDRSVLLTPALSSFGVVGPYNGIDEDGNKSSGGGDGGGMDAAYIFLILIGVALFLALIAAVAFFFWKKNKSKSKTVTRNNRADETDEPLRRDPANGNDSGVTFLRSKNEDTPELKWSPNIVQRDSLKDGLVEQEKLLGFGRKTVRPSAGIGRAKINRLSEFFDDAI